MTFLSCIALLFLAVLVCAVSLLLRGIRRRHTASLLAAALLLALPAAGYLALLRFIPAM